MNTSAIRKIFTFSLKARAISGNESLKLPQSKNVLLTSSQPGARVIAKPTTRTKSAELAIATAGVPRAAPAAGTPPAGRARPKRGRSGGRPRRTPPRRGPASAARLLLQDRRAGRLRQPRLLDLAQ